MKEMANDFYIYTGLPGAFGAIDGTDCPIHQPGQSLDWKNYNDQRNLTILKGV